MGGLNARKLKKFKFHRLKTWVLLLILAIMFFLDASFLRLDHLKMVRLRDEVLTADQNGNSEEISAALEKLKQYTFSHVIINIVDDNGGQKIFFGTGPFYLEKSYQRAANAAIEKAESELSGDNNPNGNVYLIASDTCRPIAISHGWHWYDKGYIDCMTSIINQYPNSDYIADKIYASIPSTELYRKNYASPLFSWSITGVALLLTLLIIIILILRVLIWIFLRIALIFI